MFPRSAKNDALYRIVARGCDCSWPNHRSCDWLSSMRIVVELPWPPSELSPNARTHHMVKARVVKKTRADAYVLAKAALKSSASREQMALQEIIESGASVAFWIDFYPPSRRHYDDDNLVARFKSSRDGIADGLGINDRKFRSMPFVRTDTHPGGKVVVRVTDMPGEVCGHEIADEKPAFK